MAPKREQAGPHLAIDRDRDCVRAVHDAGVFNVCPCRVPAGEVVVSAGTVVRTRYRPTEDRPVDLEVACDEDVVHAVRSRVKRAAADDGRGGV